MGIETWTAFESGKYKGKTAPEVVLINPVWFFMQLERNRDILPKWERMEIAYKASSIAIPKPDPKKWRIGWLFSSAGELLDFHVVMARDAPGDFDFIADHVDFHFVLPFMQINPKKMNLKASQRLSKAFRRNYFGGAEATKERCEAFFANNDNFVWSVIKPDFFGY